MRHQAAGVLEREGLDVDDAGLEPCGRYRCAHLLDVLAAGSHQQHVVGICILLVGPQHFEVVTDFVHGERNVLVSLHFDLGFQIGIAQVAGHLDHLRDRGIAADGDRDFARGGPRFLDGTAYGFADSLGVYQ